MEIIKDLVISVFFEFSLGLLWLVTIFSVWSAPEDFVTNPSASIRLTFRRVVAFVMPHPENFVYTTGVLVIFLIFAYPLGVSIQRVTDDFIEVGTRWMPKAQKKEDSWTSIGRDKNIREKVVKNFEHFLVPEYQAMQKNPQFLKFSPKDKSKIARKTRTRRAFAGENGAFMNHLLELVRICQATAVHFLLLSLTLFSLVWLLFIVRSVEHLQHKFLRGLVFLVFLFPFVLFLDWAPDLHNPSEYNWPTFFLLSAVFLPIFLIAFKIFWSLNKEIPWNAFGQLISGGFIALFISYFATFSWAEHRENYFEAAIVLGASTPTSIVLSPLSKVNNSGERSLIVEGFELSGSAPVLGGLLVADDELVGMVLFCPDSEIDPIPCSPVKIQRKRKKSQPFEPKSPRLAAVQDFEGLASDRKKSVYLVGSHLGKEGARRTDREFLIKANWNSKNLELDWQGQTEHLPEILKNEFINIGIPFNDLTNTEIHPDFNIEGLAFHEDILFIGFRSPLTSDGKAILCSLNVQFLFPLDVKNLNPKCDGVPLKGGGIRGLDWDPVTDKLLLIAGPTISNRPTLYYLDVLNGKPYDTSGPVVIHEFTKVELGHTLQANRFPEAVSRNFNGDLVILFDSDSPSPKGMLILPRVTQ